MRFRFVVLSLVFASVASYRATAVRSSDAACDRNVRLRELAGAASSTGSAPFPDDVGNRFDPNGVLLAPGPLTLRGPARVAEYLRGDSLNMTSRSRFLTVGGGLSADGRDGFTYGYLDAVRSSGDTRDCWAPTSLFGSVSPMERGATSSIDARAGCGRMRLIPTAFRG